MSLSEFPFLAFLLFAPWFAIVGTLFWKFPRQPRTPQRRRFDIWSLVFALTGFTLASLRAFDAANTGHPMWKQIVATSAGYGAFLLVMSIAYWVRHRRLRVA